MRSVVIATARILHYRVPLLERLYALLSERGIRLRVVYGGSHTSLRLQRDDVQLPWAEPLDSRALRLPGHVAWVPLASARQGADLVVVPEAAGWLATYDLLARRSRERFRVACWGHGPGPTDQARSRVSRTIRRSMARRFDWWFTYTDGTRRRLVLTGVEPRRITTLYNTIDIETLRGQTDVARVRAPDARGGLSLAGPTALYLGALRADKRIDVLIRSAERVAACLDGFTLIVAGDGPERPRVERAASTSPWMRYAGPAFGEQKASLLAVADILLQPAGLGLVVLDAFAAGVPVVCFDQAGHGPEEEYLRSGVEGIRVAGDDEAKLAQAVVDLLRDPQKHGRLRAGAFDAGSSHSLQDMAARFAAGIEQALR